MIFPIVPSYVPPAFLPAFNYTLNTNSGVQSGAATIVQKYQAAAIGKTGGRIKLVVMTSSVAPTTLSACYIGRSATTGNAWNFAASPTQITWNLGQTSLTILSGQTITSDEIVFDVTGGQALSVAFNIATNAAPKAVTGLSTNYIRYRKASVSEASLTTKGSSYAASSGRIDCVAQLLVAP